MPEKLKKQQNFKKTHKELKCVHRAVQQVKWLTLMLIREVSSWNTKCPDWTFY
jgi:hypothetical protein